MSVLFYVTAKHTNGRSVLAGPFVDHAGAALNVEPARLAALRHLMPHLGPWDKAELHFAAYGVTRVSGINDPGPTGRLNEELGLSWYGPDGGRWVR